MKRSLAKIWLFLIMLLPCVTVFSQYREKEIDQLLMQQFPENAPGAAVLIAKEGRITYRKSFGKANLELGVKMSPGYVFRIGSITKQFTACAILKLAGEDKLSLRDSITTYIKDYPMHGQVITIEHLLTHTSGISFGKNIWTPEMRKKDFTPEELISTFKNEPLDFLPGTSFRYNNNGYVLLGAIIEQVTGKKYKDYITDNIFRPLGMEHTCYDDPSRVINLKINGYRKYDGQYQNANFLSMTQPYAAGAILSTVEDLYVWNEALVSGKAVSKELLEKAHTSGRLQDGKQTGYGYGWWLGNIQGSAAIKHDGLINGFSAFCAYLPAEKVFVAVLSNCESSNPEIVASKIAALTIGKPYPSGRIEMPETQLESYKGVYESGSGERIISYEDGRLLFFNRGGGKDQLIPFEKDRFRFENSLTSLAFLRDPEGHIVAMVTKNTEAPVNWKRTPKEVQAMKSIAVDVEILDRYVGKYQFISGFMLNITREGNKMYGKAPGPQQVRQEILPYEKDRFFARDLDARLTFNRDEQGNVIGLTKEQNGEQVAKKVE